MRLRLVALNAKYNHTNLAVRSIVQYAREHGAEDISFLELTVNHNPDDILERMVREEAELYLFSCYIWNIALAEKVAENLRKLRPQALIGAGGPEVSYASEAFLRKNPAFDFLLTGEGEESAAGVFLAMQAGQEWRACPGLVYRNGDALVQTAPAPVPAMDEVPFGYEDLAVLTGRTLYYESTRGCPFACSYCLSSVQKGVRERSLELVFAHLERFLEACVRQVKFVDRTFNANPERALAIWRFLAERDNGVTNFHFELAAGLLCEQQLAFLKGVRPGLFQFEIGVQSLNGDTLRTIRRPQDRDKLTQMVTALREPGNIHLHLDLIAGLPNEELESFIDSFNGVYALRSHQLQLGFLKVLKGSEMERTAAEHGIVYRAQAPYQVLYTRWLSYEQLSLLKAVERMVEIYYNSGRFSAITEHLCARFSTPFAFYKALAEKYVRAEQSGVVGKTQQYELLAELMREYGEPVTQTAQWLCKFDLLCNERPRKLPNWIQAKETQLRRQEVKAFLTALPPEECNVHVEYFPFDPRSGKEEPVALLFDYSRRDFTGKAECRAVEL